MSGSRDSFLVEPKTAGPRKVGANVTDNKVNPEIKRCKCNQKEMFDQSIGEHIVRVFVYIAIGGGVLLCSAIGAILIGDEIKKNIKVRS